MSEKQYYTAIDLGTTNSVIAYGNIQNNVMRPIVLELDRKNDMGSKSRNPLLPSVVFYYKNNEDKIVTDIGDYAKSRYGTRAGYVCKSVKSLMGTTDQVPLVEEIPDKTPSDVSAQILSFMVNSAKKRLFQNELSDVIITVPASFDSDQCQATIDAARKAGINVENMHDVLLYEPKAVIYDFMRMQECGEIPSDLLSLDTEKNVLVFDLGGGTLDVTIHKVGYTDTGILNIKDLAISRYTLLGGDNFDELLAADMLKRFEEINGIKVSIKRKEEVMCKLRKLAEKLKVDLSQAYDSARMSDVELPEDYELEVMDIDLYDSYAYADTYTKSDVERIVSPLMGEKYKISDVSKIQHMDEKEVNNIIYPILDVMDKCGKDVKIDAVILNGGMTKFYLIQKRLREFFGFEPLTTSDPDLSVARGAVYYHYCLHKYNVRKLEEPGTPEAADAPASKSASGIAFNTSTILNDTINLGLRGEYVSQLIPAGTELPYKSEEIRDKYKLDKATNSLGIEMFLGRGSTKNLPNRRIATRTVKFDKSYPADTAISFQIYINSMRMMTMEAWITGRPETKKTMEMDMASLKRTAKTTKNIGTVEKMRLNAKSELNELKAMSDRNRNKLGHELNPELSRRLETIGQASNPEDFFAPCMDIARSCKQSDLMFAYIYMIAGMFKDGWSDSQKKQVLSYARQHFTPYASAIKQNYYVLRRALEVIGLFDDNFADFCTEYMGRVYGDSTQFKNVILQLVIRYEKDDKKVADFLNKFFHLSDFNKWIAALMANRFGMETTRENQKYLVKFVKTITPGLAISDENDTSQYVAVLISELCANQNDNPICADSYTMKHTWSALGKYLSTQQDSLFVSAVTNLWNGTDLSIEESALIHTILSA